MKIEVGKSYKAKFNCSIPQGTIVQVESVRPGYLGWEVKFLDKTVSSEAFVKLFERVTP